MFVSPVIMLSPADEELLEIERTFRQIAVKLLAQLLNSPPLPVMDWQRLPAVSGNYGIVNRDGKLMYLGKAVDTLRGRGRDHYRKLSASRLIVQDYAFLSLICVPELAVAVEEFGIRQHQPAWNGMGFGNKVQGCKRASANAWERQYGRLDSDNFAV